jgi:hypothetical protein
MASKARVYEAAAATARSLGTSYGAFYGAMYDVSSILAAQMKRVGNTNATHKLLAAGMMWDIRAKTSSTVSLHTDDSTSLRAGYYVGATQRYHITTAPYAAYSRWLNFINSEKYVSLESKRSFPHHSTGPISTAFSGRTAALFPLGSQSKARVFRYANCPDTLARDIERTLSEMMTDIKAVITQYESEERMVDMDMPVGTAPAAIAFDIDKYMSARNSYWTLIAQLEPDLAVAVEDTVAALPDSERDEIMATVYEDPTEMAAAIFRTADKVESIKKSSRDLVQ